MDSFIFYTLKAMVSDFKSWWRQ